MSRHAAIELDWADGNYTFRLGLKELEELEEKCDLGVFQIYQKLHPAGMRDFRSKHLSEVIRLGLLGGGMKPVECFTLVRRYLDERPIEENRDAAFAIVGAALARVHGGELERRAEAGEADEGKPETDE